MVVSLHFTGVDAWNVAVDHLVLAADVANEQIVSKGGRAVELATEAHMHGRPGPNSRSGALAASESAAPQVTQLGPGRWESRSGPRTAYGRRIELGFHGTDSRGRVYNQPAYPFVEPGLRDAEPLLEAIYYAEWASALTA